MMKRLFVLWIVLVMLTVSNQAQEATEEVIITRTTAPNSASIRLEMILDELWRPLFLTHADDQTGRLFVVEQGGRIYALDNDGQHLFLDLSSIVTGSANFPTYTEHGLLGL